MFSFFLKKRKYLATKIGNMVRLDEENKREDL